MLKAFNRSRSSRITHGCLKPNAELVLCHGHFIKNQVIHLHCWNNFLIYQLPTKNTNICKFTNGFSMLKWYFFFFDDYNAMPTWNLIFSFFLVIHPFLLWQLGFEGLISGLANRRNRIVLVLDKVFMICSILKMLGAYVQIHRIKLFISARPKDDIFSL